MKYYDNIISLGQWCAASACLRRLHLQDRTNVFDWSGGLLLDKCGQGGLSGKVDLICNEFKDFFNFEDFENRGTFAGGDPNKSWIVNKRTGLQYRHDFPASQSFEAVFPAVQKKYIARAKRLLNQIASSEKCLFVFITDGTGYEDTYLIEQQLKLAAKFPTVEIDFCYLMHDDSYDTKSYSKRMLSKNVCRIDLNYNYPPETSPRDHWLGNKDMFDFLLEGTYISEAKVRYAFDSLKKLKTIEEKQDLILKKLDETIANFSRS